MAEEPAVKILFFTTSCPSTLKVRGDIERITQILNAKRIQYEEVRLADGLPCVFCLHVVMHGSS